MQLFNSKAIYAIVVFFALALNWQFVKIQKLDDLPMPVRTWDMSGIIDGYQKSPEFMGGFKFWSGPWIYTNSQSYRPITSHFHWAQCWLLENHGWFWCSLTTLALFVAICVTVAALVKRWTGSGVFGLLAGIMVAGIRFFNPNHFDFWLAWFPVADFLLSLAFFFAGMLVVDLYAERRTTRLFVGSLALFLASCLSKELGYIFPVVAMVLYLHRSEKKKDWWPLPIMFLAAVGLFLIRRMFVPNARAAEMDWSKAYNYVFERNEFFFAFATQQWWMLALSALLSGATYSIWRWGWKRTLPYSAVSLFAFAVGCLFLAPEALLAFESPMMVLEQAFFIALVPAGTYFALRDKVGRMSLAVLATIHVPMLPFVHNQLFHYTLTTALFSVLHTAVLASVLWRSWGTRPQQLQIEEQSQRILVEALP